MTAQIPDESEMFEGEHPSATRQSEVHALAEQDARLARWRVVRKYYTMVTKNVQCHYPFLSDEEVHDGVMGFLLDDRLKKKVDRYLESGAKRFRWFLVQKAREWIANEWRRDERRRKLLEEHFVSEAKLPEDILELEEDENQRIRELQLTIRAVGETKADYLGKIDEWKFRAWELSVCGGISNSQLVEMFPPHSRRTIANAVTMITSTIASKMKELGNG